jgi:hypothetical protein
MLRISTVNHANGKTTKQLVDIKTTSKKIKNAKKKQKKIKKIERIADPDRPKNRPKKRRLSDEKSGKNTIDKYIKKKTNF